MQSSNVVHELLYSIISMGTLSIIYTPTIYCELALKFGIVLFESTLV